MSFVMVGLLLKKARLAVALAATPAAAHTVAVALAATPAAAHAVAVALAVARAASCDASDVKDMEQGDCGR